MRPAIRWQAEPHARLYQVFDCRRRSRGVWLSQNSARAELAKYPGGSLLVVDEYYAKLPDLGHIKRVVVA